MSKHNIFTFQGTYENGKLKRLTTVDVLPIGALQHDIEVQHINIEQTCKGFKGCIAQDKTLVQEGEPFAYKSYNDEVLIYLCACTQLHNAVISRTGPQFVFS